MLTEILLNYNFYQILKIPKNSSLESIKNACENVLKQIKEYKSSTEEEALKTDAIKKIEDISIILQDPRQKNIYDGFLNTLPSTEMPLFKYTKPYLGRFSKDDYIHLYTPTFAAGKILNDRPYQEDMEISGFLAEFANKSEKVKRYIIQSVYFHLGLALLEFRIIGCTACSCFTYKIDNKLHIATGNIGDSRAYLILINEKNEVEGFPLTIPHEAHGDEALKSRDNILNVKGALGDNNFRSAGLIDIPDITIHATFDLTGKKAYVILGSDGAFSKYFIDLPRLIEIFKKNPDMGAKEVITTLMSNSMSLKSKDNISIAVKVFEHTPLPNKKQYTPKESKQKINTESPTTYYMAVFDGHNGPDAAIKASEMFPVLISNETRAFSNLPKQWVEDFLLEKEFKSPDILKNNSRKEIINDVLKITSSNFHIELKRNPYPKSPDYQSLHIEVKGKRKDSVPLFEDIRKNAALARIAYTQYCYMDVHRFVLPLPNYEASPKENLSLRNLANLPDTFESFFAFLIKTLQDNKNNPWLVTNDKEEKIEDPVSVSFPWQNLITYSAEADGADEEMLLTVLKDNEVPEYNNKDVTITFGLYDTGAKTNLSEVKVSSIKKNPYFTKTTKFFHFLADVKQEEKMQPAIIKYSSSTNTTLGKNVDDILTPHLIQKYIPTDHYLKCYGYVIGPDSFMPIMERADLGRLDDFLGIYQKKGHSVPLIYRIKISLDIAKGLLHLHKNQLVHQSLMSENIFLTKGMNAKISGLSGLHGSVKDENTNKVASIKPDSDAFHKLMRPPEGYDDTTEGDMFTLAFVLQEIFALEHRKGFIGYPGYCFSEMMMNGLIEAIPQGCPAEIGDFIWRCWSFSPAKRPTASDAVAFFEAELKKEMKKSHMSEFKIDFEITHPIHYENRTCGKHSFEPGTQDSKSLLANLKKIDLASPTNCLFVLKTEHIAHLCEEFKFFMKGHDTQQNFDIIAAHLSRSQEHKISIAEILNTCNEKKLDFFYRCSENILTLPSEKYGALLKTLKHLLIINPDLCTEMHVYYMMKEVEDFNLFAKKIQSKDKISPQEFLDLISSLKMKTLDQKPLPGLLNNGLFVWKKKKSDPVKKEQPAQINLGF